jgi:hypothetical protein
MMVEFNTILSFIQAVGIIVGVAYYIMNIQNNQRTQKLQLYNSYLQYRLTEEYWDRVLEVLYQEWETYDEWYSKYGSRNNKESWLKFQTICVFFNSLGEVTQDLKMGINVIHDALGPVATMIWDKIEPIVVGERKRYLEQYGMSINYLGNFEYLVDEIKKHRKTIFYFDNN